MDDNLLFVLFFQSLAISWREYVLSSLLKTGYFSPMHFKRIF